MEEEGVRRKSQRVQFSVSVRTKERKEVRVPFEKSFRQRGGCV